MKPERLQWGSLRRRHRAVIGHHATFTRRQGVAEPQSIFGHSTRPMLATASSAAGVVLIRKQPVRLELPSVSDYPEVSSSRVVDPIILTEARGPST